MTVMLKFPTRDGIARWLNNNNFYRKTYLNKDSEDTEAWEDCFEEDRVDDPTKATVIGSKFVNGRHPLHKVFIDLDVEHQYVPSSTEGHGHLYINVDLTPAELLGLMQALEKVGIIGKGWTDQVRYRGENTFRLPGVTKEVL